MDILPGLREFEERLADVLGGASRDIAVARVELDRVDRVGRWFGPDVEAQVRTELDRRLVQDVPGAVLVARQPRGIRWLALRVEDPDPQVLERLAWNLMETISAPVRQTPAGDVSVGSAVGLAHERQMDDLDAASLISGASLACYRAAALGSRRVAVFEERYGMSGRRGRLDSGLAQALEDGDIVPWFQPQVDLSSGDVIGAEAVVRWQHPEFGTVAPAEFLPEAEFSGIVRNVDYTLLRSAVAEASVWPAPIGLSVNLSSATLGDPNLVDSILAICHDAGREPGRLTVEITETTVATSRVAALEKLRELKSTGITVSLDDFGSGYAFFDALAEGHFSEVKIDGDLFRRASARGDDAFLAAVVSVGLALGLPVLAEGIEDRADVERARRMGCSRAQGYYFARPMPAQQMRALLDSGQRLPIQES